VRLRHKIGLLSVGFEKFGSEEKLNQNAIKHLFDVYVAVNEDAEKDASVHDLARRHFARMEEGAFVCYAVVCACSMTVTNSLGRLTDGRAIVGIAQSTTFLLL
jgi:arginyl-tRNA synthetase